MIPTRRCTDLLEHLTALVATTKPMIHSGNAHEGLSAVAGEQVSIRLKGDPQLQPDSGRLRRS